MISPVPGSASTAATAASSTAPFDCPLEQVEHHLGLRRVDTVNSTSVGIRSNRRRGETQHD